MKTQLIGLLDIETSRMILGCMRLASKTVEKAKEIIQTAHDLGIRHFEHAYIYGQGKSEKIFAEALKKTNIKKEEWYEIYLSAGNRLT